MLIVFSIFIITYNINKTDRHLNERLNNILKMASIYVGPAVWQLHYDYIHKTVDALFLQDILVYFSIRDDLERELAVKHRPPYEGKPFSFFRNSKKFKTGRMKILYQETYLGTLQVAVSRDRVYKELAGSTLIAVVAMTLIITAVVVTTILITRRRIIFPILKLQESAARIASGNLETDVDKGGADEIGHLAKDLDIMRKSIRGLIHDLKGANLQLEEYAGTLERKVEERTQRLSETLKAVEYANNMITGSIRYAEKIQSSLLPAAETLDHFLDDYFIIWEPSDIVGGDIYQVEHTGRGCLIAVFDCTGHGIPGAFMTMIAGTMFKRAASGSNFHDPAKLLQTLNVGLVSVLYRDGKETVSDDGMDAGLCYIDPQRETLVYAGAKIHLIRIEEDELITIKGDRRSLGYRDTDTGYMFTNHKIDLKPGMRFYLSSDGYTGQAGGPKGLSLGKRRMNEKLLEIHQKSFDSQKADLLDYLNEWQGDRERQDDVTVIGFGFNL